MGVQSFFKLFKPEYEIKIEKGKGKDKKVFGIDAMVELYRSSLGMNMNNKLTDSKGNSTVHINVILQNVMRHIMNNIRTTWIFDNRSCSMKDMTTEARWEAKKAARAKLKNAKTEEERNKFSKQAFSMDKSIIDDAKYILDCFEVPYVVIPTGYEAEEVGAWMTNSTSKYRIDYLITTDSDALLFGAQGIIRRDYVNKKNQLIELEDILEDNNLTQDDLIKIGVILGCDFAGKTPGVGYGSVLKKIKTKLEKDLEKDIKKIKKEIEKKEKNIEENKKRKKKNEQSSSSNLRLKPVDSRNLDEELKKLEERLEKAQNNNEVRRFNIVELTEQQKLAVKRFKKKKVPLKEMDWHNKHNIRKKIKVKNLDLNKMKSIIKWLKKKNFNTDRFKLFKEYKVYHKLKDI